MVRGAITSGSGGSETSDNYYASNRGELPNQGSQSRGCTVDGYEHDGKLYIVSSLGTFRIDGMEAVAVERVRDELVKLLAADRPSIGLELMRTTGLLEAMLPELG